MAGICNECVEGKGAVVKIERAGAGDLPAIVAVYADDRTGGHGDRWDEAIRPAYEAAFARLAANPDYELYVARDGGRVVGTFLLHFTLTLVGGGGESCTLHSVSVPADCRGRGIGALMLRAAEARAKARGARILRLTSSMRRGDAHRFYEREGYLQTHKAYAKSL